MKRKLYLDITARLDAPEAIVVTGMRRVGKTTLLQQIYDSLTSENKIFLDLENPVSQKYFETENYETVKYQLETLGIDARQKAYVFLDEIQYVKNAPSVVKYLSDHYGYKFFLTGSSSFYLKNLFTESLAGRKILFELYPLDFEEFLELKGSSLRIPPIGACTKPIYDTIIPFYREYVEFGGFPGVVSKKSIPEKCEALTEIFTAYFNKEVTVLSGFRNNAVARDLMLLLTARIGSKVDIQKLSSELGVSRITVSSYLSFLEGTYFISLISPYSRGKDTEIRGAKKVYLCDSGLANVLTKTALGHIFENAVFHALRTRGNTIRYYQRKSGVELDFIDEENRGWEVKMHADPADSTRTIRLTNELKLTKGHVVSFAWSDNLVAYGFQI